MSNETIYDNPTGWVGKHVKEYVETDGRRGHKWSGVHTLLLTTRGWRSGKLRRTALIYRKDEDRFVIVASKGGRKYHPAWYLNLVTEPQVHVQVGADKFRATARTAQADKRERLWDLMVAIWPEYENYQRRTERQIPVVVLEPLAA